MVAREAARAGLKVIVLEEGAYSLPRDFTQREDEMLPLLFQDAGAYTFFDVMTAAVFQNDRFNAVQM